MSEKELLEMLAFRINTLEEELQSLKADYQKIIQAHSNINCTEPNEDEIFEKVFLVYERYMKLRALAKENNICMTHLGACSTFITMFRARCQSINPVVVKKDVQAYWYHGRSRNPSYPKPESHKSFENLSTFKKLLTTPNNLITDKMLDAIILEDMTGNGATNYKFFKEFIALMD